MSRIGRFAGLRRGIAASALLALTLGTLTGCDAAGEDVGAGTWTVLVYSIADTDLEPYMMDDIDELGQVEASDSLSLVTFIDRADGYTDGPVLGMDDWVGAKILEVTPGGAIEQQDLGDVNTGDAAVLADFISWGLTNYPADNYSLIISDHGASWPGVGGDESSEEDTLSLAELDAGIADGLAAAGVDRLDLLGFDACLMATWEVAHALSARADRLLASQELEPGHGWDYSALQYLVDNPGADVDELGQALIDGFEAQAQAEDTQAEITLSLVDLTRISEVDEALANFSTALTTRMLNIAPVVGRTRAQTLGFGRSPDPTQDSQMADLGILAGEIGVDALDVSDEADALVRAVNDVVVAKVDGQATRGATGLSIYFPPSPDVFDTDYEELGIDAAWLDFLRSYYGRGQEAAAAVSGSFVSAASAVFDADGVTVTASFDTAAAESITESFIRYAVVEDDGSITYLGQETAELPDENGLIEGSYDLSFLEISDGETSMSAYLDLVVDDAAGIVTMDIPLAYYGAKDVAGETYRDALLSLVVDSDSGDLVSELYYTYNARTGNYGAMTADPTGIIAPELLSVHADGSEEWLASADNGLWADLPSLSYDFPQLASGTVLLVELVAVDLAGNRSTATVHVVVP